MKWSDCRANRKPRGVFFIHNLFLRYFLLTVLSAEALPIQRGFVGIHLGGIESPPVFGFPRKSIPLEKPNQAAFVGPDSVLALFLLFGCRKVFQNCCPSNIFFNTILQVLFMVPIGLSVGVISAFQIPAFCNNSNLVAVFLLLLLFG